MEQSVPKRQHIEFRFWGITQKKALQRSEHGKSFEIKKFCDLCGTNVPT